LGTFLLALLSLLLVSTPSGCATSKPTDACRSTRMTRQEVAKLRGVDLEAAEIEIRCTTYDQIIQVRDPAGNLNKSTVWWVKSGTESVVIDDASGLILGSGGCCGTRGPPPVEPMPPQP